MPDDRSMHLVSRIALVAILCGAALGRADEPSSATQRPLLQPPVEVIASPITDHFAVRVMYYRPSVSTTARYDNDAGTAGTTFNGEDVLGLQKNRNQGWIDLMFRMTARHRIQAQFYQLKRSGDAVLSQTLDFGNHTFQPTDGRILSSMELRQLNLTYTYSVLRQERFELGVGLGIHLLQLDGTLDAPATFKREHLNAAGPYPALGGDVTWRFTRRFSASAAAHYITFSSGGKSASSLDWNAEVQFRAQRNLAVGLGYAGTSYRVDSSDPKFFLGYVKLHYQGPELFLRASF
jgi:hypothetical protein